MQEPPFSFNRRLFEIKNYIKEDLKDWTKELFEEKSYNMIDVSDKKVTLRRALLVDQ